MLVFALNVNRLRKLKTLEKGNYKSLFWLGLIVLIIVTFDQITKIWAVNNLTGKPSLEIMGQFFMLTLVYNEGGALGTNFGPSQYYLISSILILLFILFYIFQNRNYKMIAIPLAFITGGAIGNIIDRIRLQKIIDFIDVDFFDINIFGYQLHRFWTFNIADASISCSIAFLLTYMLFFSKSLKDDQKPDLIEDSE